MALRYPSPRSVTRSPIRTPQRSRTTGKQNLAGHRWCTRNAFCAGRWCRTDGLIAAVTTAWARRRNGRVEILSFRLRRRSNDTVHQGLGYSKTAGYSCRLQGPHWTRPRMRFAFPSGTSSAALASLRRDTDWDPSAAVALLGLVLEMRWSRRLISMATASRRHPSSTSSRYRSEVERTVGGATRGGAGVSVDDDAAGRDDGSRTVDATTILFGRIRHHSRRRANAAGRSRKAPSISEDTGLRRTRQRKRRTLSPVVWASP